MVQCYFELTNQVIANCPDLLLATPTFVTVFQLAIACIPLQGNTTSDFSLLVPSLSLSLSPQIADTMLSLILLFCFAEREVAQRVVGFFENLFYKKGPSVTNKLIHNINHAMQQHGEQLIRTIIFVSRCVCCRVCGSVCSVCMWCCALCVCVVCVMYVVVCVVYC